MRVDIDPTSPPSSDWMSVDERAARYLRSIQQTIIESVERADAGALGYASMHIASAFLSMNRSRDEIFAFLMQTAFGPACLAMEGSWHLFTAFERCWPLLSSEQQHELLDAVRRHYAAFQDWMAWFVVSELLGRVCANRAAFDVLNELRSIENEHARSFVPHGYEHLARGRTNERLGRNALEMLLSMAADPSERVHRNVAISLDRIDWDEDDMDCRE